MCRYQYRWYHRMQSGHFRLQYVYLDVKIKLSTMLNFFSKILAKPKVDGKINDVSVQINEPAELRAKFSALPKPTVAW